MRISKRVLFFTSVVIVLLVLVAAGAYSAMQVRAGKKLGLYRTPEECMYALMAEKYTGIQRIEIGRMDREFFDRLRLIKVYVYADGCKDGSPLPERGYGQEEHVFVKTGAYWTLMKKNRFPRIVALGQWLLGPLS
jgi:hypothetical protein